MSEFREGQQGPEQGLTNVWDVEFGRTGRRGHIERLTEAGVQEVAGVQALEEMVGPIVQVRSTLAEVVRPPTMGPPVLSEPAAQGKLGLIVNNTKQRLFDNSGDRGVATITHRVHAKRLASTPHPPTTIA